jgi:glycerol kinase
VHAGTQFLFLFPVLNASPLADHTEQTQANIIGIPVDRPAMRETTALGAAIAAGFAVGVWKEFDELKEINQKDRMIFEPNVSKDEGEKMFKKWGRVS